MSTAESCGLDERATRRRRCRSSDIIGAGVHLATRGLIFTTIAAAVFALVQVFADGTGEVFEDILGVQGAQEGLVLIGEGFVPRFFVLARGGGGGRGEELVRMIFYSRHGYMYKSNLSLLRKRSI